ncbi:MAG: glycosyltransferase [Ignisphaera sp.]|uniref:Glycosyltransferase n=1 Tax=Ignisphaera aggregans TaxID=334771 RepID=A0A7C4JKC3_9CREN
MDTKTDLRELSIIIPVHNEEKAIGFVLDEILSLGIPPKNVVVVDGGSTDKTIEIARSRGVLVVKQNGKGKADAIKTGLKYISTPYVLVIDGDGTYPVSYVPKLLTTAKLDDCDLVIGVRLQGKESQKFIFKLGNKVLTMFFNTLFGVKLRDILSGMYVAKLDKLRKVDFEMKGFSVESEIVAHFATLSSICEEVIEYKPRIDPNAKKLKVFHGFKIAIDMIRLTWRYNPAFLIFILGSLILIPGLALGVWVGYHYFFVGVNYYMKGLVAIMLTLAGFNSLIAAIITVYAKRSEIRLNKQLEEIRRDLNRIKSSITQK